MSDIQESSAPSTSPELQICGWMHFKHQETGAMRTSPAIATFISRPVAWGEPTRMALRLRSPVADAAGEWEEVRHASWANGVVAEAKQWTPMGFSPNDPSIEPAVAARIAQLLESNAREAAKKRPPERRARMCRFDHWLPGWGTDLAWDPFKDLGVSAKEIAKLAAEGLIPQDGAEILDHWLAQPVAEAPKRRYSNYGKGKEPSQDKDSSQAKAAPSSSMQKPSQAPARPEPAVQTSTPPSATQTPSPKPPPPSDEASPFDDAAALAAPNAPAPKAPPPSDDASPFNDAAALAAPNAPAPKAPPPSDDASPFDDAAPLAAPSAPVPKAPPPSDEPSPFDDAPALEAQTPIVSNIEKLDPPANGSPAGPDVESGALVSLDELAGGPLLDIPPPSQAPDWAMDIGGFDDDAFARPPTDASPPTEPAATQPAEAEPPAPAEETGEPDERDAAAKAIFAGPDLPDFSAVAQAAGIAWTAKDAARARNSAPHEPPAASQPSSEAPAREASPAREKSLALAFARYPAHGDDGAVRWESALLSVEGFMSKELFEAAKPHWRATREGAKRKESLYSIALMQACLDKGQAFTLEGCAPAAKFVGSAEGKPALDAQNFALSVLARSGFEPAANIPALVRAKHYRDRLAELCKSAAREKAGDLPQDGWTQVSPGPAREDTTKVHSQQGLVSWFKQGQRLATRLSSAEDRAKLAKLAEALAIAAAHAKPADPTPSGLIPPGAPTPRDIPQRSAAPKGRP